MQAYLFYKLLNNLLGFTIRAAIEKIPLDTVVGWLCKILPAIDIEGPKHLSTRGVGLNNGYAIRWATAQLVRSIDDNFILKLGGMSNYCLLHSRTWNSE